MTFNLKKHSQKDSVLPYPKGISEQTEKYNLSLDKKDIVSIDGLLDADRRPIEAVVTHEAMLDESRKKATKSERTVEGELENVSSDFPHRQFEEGTKSHVSSQALLAEAFDRKYRDAFSKANKGSDTEFWDKHIGVDLENEKTKVSSQVPDKANQLQNTADRFGNLDGLPHNSDPTKNRENLGKALKVKPMQGYKGNEKPLTMAMSSLNNADKLLFNMYLQASTENRPLTSLEQELIKGINKDKQSILMSLSQYDPSMPHSNPNPNTAPLSSPLDNQQPLVNPLEGQPPSANPLDNQTDFLDGNPTVGDEGLLAQESGVNLSDQSPLEQQPVAGDDAFEGIDMDTGEPIPEMGNNMPPMPGEGSSYGEIPLDTGEEPPVNDGSDYFNLDEGNNDGLPPV